MTGLTFDRPFSKKPMSYDWIKFKKPIEYDEIKTPSTHAINQYTSTYSSTGWRRLIGSPKLQIIFHKRATTKYRSLLQKMTYKDKGSYQCSPPCTDIFRDINGYFTDPSPQNRHTRTTRARMYLFKTTGPRDSTIITNDHIQKSQQWWLNVDEWTPEIAISFVKRCSILKKTLNSLGNTIVWGVYYNRWHPSKNWRKHRCVAYTITCTHVCTVLRAHMGVYFLLTDSRNYFMGTYQISLKRWSPGMRIDRVMYSIG